MLALILVKMVIEQIKTEASKQRWIEKPTCNLLLIEHKSRNMP